MGLNHINLASLLWAPRQAVSVNGDLSIGSLDAVSWIPYQDADVIATLPRLIYAGDAAFLHSHMAEDDSCLLLSSRRALLTATCCSFLPSPFLSWLILLVILCLIERFAVIGFGFKAFRPRLILCVV